MAASIQEFAWLKLCAEVEQWGPLGPDPTIATTGAIMKTEKGYIVVSENDKTRAMKPAYSTFQGNATRLDRNFAGNLCEREGSPKPQVWKTKAAAQRAADKKNAFHAKIPNSGCPLGRVCVESLHMNTAEALSELRHILWTNPALISKVIAAL